MAWSAASGIRRIGCNIFRLGTEAVCKERISFSSAGKLTAKRADLRLTHLRPHIIMEKNVSDYAVFPDSRSRFPAGTGILLIWKGHLR